MGHSLMHNFQTSSWLGKSAYLLTALLFVTIPFAGLVLEPLGIVLIGFPHFAVLYVGAIACSVLAGKWRLVLVVALGGLYVWGGTIFFAEVLWYYFKDVFGIDLYPR